MLDYERIMLGTDRGYHDGTVDAERAKDARAQAGSSALEDRFALDFDVVPLLDSAPILDVGQVVDPERGGWCRVEPAYPIRMSIQPKELGGLAALIDQMIRELGVSFTIERVFWTEDELFVLAVPQEEPDRSALEAESD